MTPMRIFVLCAATLALCACGNQYWIRQDAITFSNGDAVASNISAQVPDPWPRGSNNPSIPMDPVKAQKAIERYHAGTPLRDDAPAGDGPGRGFAPTLGLSNGGAPN